MFTGLPRVSNSCWMTAPDFFTVLLLFKVQIHYKPFKGNLNVT